MTSESSEIDGTEVPIIGLKNDGTPITPATGLVSPFFGNYVESGVQSGVQSGVPDGSGNLWATPSDGSLVEFVGLTTPVATPVLPKHIGQRP